MLGNLALQTRSEAAGMKLLTAIRLLYQKYLVRDGDEYASYVLADKLCALLYPKYKFSEFDRLWLGDAAFFRNYERLVGRDNYHSAGRKFFLRSLLPLTRDVPGDTAECGVFQGASSYFICAFTRGSGKRHHLFDSFAGLSQPAAADGAHWREHDFAADEAIALRNLAEFDFVESHKGWIPSEFSQVADRRFSFVHVDVDLYQPTRDSVEFFYPRLAPGGILLCDDYGFGTCPGAKRAVDEFLRDKPEPLVHVPTGQGLFIKQG